MTKFRHYDSELDRWIIDGASNASNLELTNPGFIDEKGNSISIDHGFTKLNNRMSRLEQNLAWIYLNGAKGGGGGTGPGGGGGGEYYIDMQYLDSTVYTTTGKITLTLLIFSGNLSKTFKISVRGLKSGTLYIKELSQRSLTRFLLDITGIEKDDELEITALDVNGAMTPPVYVLVIVGAIYLDMTPNKPNTLVIWGNAVLNSYTFTVTNKTKDSTLFYLYLSDNKDPYGNKEIPIYLNEVKNSSRSFKFDIMQILKDNTEVMIGNAYKIQAIAVHESLGIKTPYKQVNVIVTASDRLIISTFNISTSPGKELTELVQGNYAQIQCLFSYSKSDYSDFGYSYKVFLNLDGPEVLVDLGRLDSLVTPNQSFIIGYSTSKLVETKVKEFYRMEIKGFPSVDPESTNTLVTYTHNIYFTVTESDQSILKARNYNNELLAYFGPFTFNNDNSTGIWNYKFSRDPNNEFYYDDIYKDLLDFLNGLNIKAYKIDGKTSGFLSDTYTNVTKMALPSNSYAEIDAFKVLLPLWNPSLITSTAFGLGFCISCTYKAEQSVDSSETILSLGNYEYDKLASGFEITLDKATIKIKGSAETYVDLPQNKLITIDLNVEPSMMVTENETLNIYYFSLYLNGVLSACFKAFLKDVDWLFGKSLFLGCREDLTHFSICDIYDFKIYTKPLSSVSIVQNYISATEQANLRGGGAIDSSLDADLRMQNFFIGKKETKNEGPCVLWDYALNKYIEGEKLFGTLLGYVKEGLLQYPLVYIQETDPDSTFSKDVNAVWTEGDKAILNALHPAIIKLITKHGDCVIAKPEAVTDVNKGPRISIQGTSSLAYMSKNFEIYAGNIDDSGTPMLVNVKDDWLPENEFTLKADVVDSGHVNNVAIGKIINNTPGLMENTPPMDSNYWVETKGDDSIRHKIKHTSDGFPCLVFIKFSDPKVGTKFLGIYNFNLGRYAYYNLGLKLLKTYTKPDNIAPEAPFVVTEYKDKIDEFKGNTYSLELTRHNNNRYEAFSQADLNTVMWMTSCKYTSREPRDAYVAATNTLYKCLAEMVPNGTQKVYMRTTPDELGEYVLKGGPDYGIESSRWYDTAECGKYLNLNNAVCYYLIAMIFGMVDSTCKNMTLRSWGGLRWYTCFYDMDTAFKMDNAGAQVVKYDAHFHNFYNVIAKDDLGLTLGYTNDGKFDGGRLEFLITGIERFSKTGGVKGDHPEFYLYYASTWSRLWEALEYLPIKNSYDATTQRFLYSIGTVYWKLRKDVLKDPRKFIEDNYVSYVKLCGPILYNYDYNLKYITLAKVYKEINGELVLVDDSNSKLETFLHGTRVDAVVDWFVKRIYFLDGVYSSEKPGIKEDGNVSHIESPLNSIWNDNKAGMGDTEGQDTSIGEIQVSAKSKVKFATLLGSENPIYAWIDELKLNITVRMPIGQQLVALYANKYLTNFDNFKRYNWSELPTIDLPELISLDLSGLQLRIDLFGGKGAYENGVGLKNIKHLNLSGVTVLDKETLSINLVGCSKLETLNLSNSGYTNFTLPASGSLRELDLSNTKIMYLGKVPVQGETPNIFENLPSLEFINLSGCNLLEEIHIRNCESLKSLDIPPSVRKLWIVNCAGLDTVYCPNSNVKSLLKEVHIENCKNLRELNLQGLNNPDLTVSLLGCTGIENLLLSNSSITSETLKLPSGWNTLRKLDITKTKISYFNYGEGSNTQALDLKVFENLQELLVSQCSNITKLICSNVKDVPIQLNVGAFKNCNGLTTLYGHFEICANEVFLGCSLLKFNLPINQDFVEGDNVLNLDFSPNLNTLLNTFNGCSSLDIDSFKYIMNKLPKSVTSLEGAFINCSGVLGKIHTGLLSACPNLTTLKDAFTGTGLMGSIESRRSNYSLEDSSTWGFFDFVPHLTSIEGAFSGSLIEAIDEHVFDPILNLVTNIDNCFLNCTQLRSVKDASALVYEDAVFSSKTFFTNFTRLSNPFGLPENVFAGCVGIKMHIDEELVGDTLITYLFHTKSRSSLNMIIKDSLYSGIDLIGNIGENTFGGITKDLGEFVIPNIVSIQKPFSSCSGSNITIALNLVPRIFQNLPIRLLINVFNGIKCIEGTDIIPDNLFINCLNLVSISGLFNNIKITNNKQIYKFPSKDMFKDCVLLEDISLLFYNQNELKIELQGEGFKNCKLKNVQEAFAGSGLFGVIPYRLWFMEYNGEIQRTLNNISNVFMNCHCLGYDSTRTIKTDLVYNEQGDCFPWSLGIVDNPGNPVYYTLEQPIIKTKNYNINQVQKIKENFNSDTLIDNPLYSPNELEYDIWKMDGRPWVKPEDADPVVWNIWDTNYFKWDRLLLEAILAESSTLNKYVDTAYLNYIIPCDYFRYCDPKCEFLNSLSGITRQEVKYKTLESGLHEIDYQSKEPKELYGLKGRIPCKLFEPLMDSETIKGVFDNIDICAYVNLFYKLNGLLREIKRGYKFPFDLLFNNTKLKDISGLFKGVKFEVGVDINPKLFSNNQYLNTINNVFENCVFNSDEYISTIPTRNKYNQIPCSLLFSNNLAILFASRLFAGTPIKATGPLLMELSLFSALYEMIDISGMFSYCTLMYGSVPTFSLTAYQNLMSYDGYLEGCSKSNITNADQITHLWPLSWKN